MSTPPNLPKSPTREEAALRRLVRFHSVLTAVNPQDSVTPVDRPAEFLHYLNPLSTFPLLRPPPISFQELDREQVPRPGALPALYSALFSSDRRRIPTAPLDRESLSQFLYDSLAVCDGDRDPRSGFLPRVPSSSGGSHPTVAHVMTPVVPGLVRAPFAAHYSPEDHALEARAVLDPKLFSDTFPNSAFLVGLSTVYSRETWRHGNRGFRCCHLDIGHAVAAVAFAAAALGWDVRLLSELGQYDMQWLMGSRPFRPQACFRGTMGPRKFPAVELEDPVCVLVVFPNTVRSFSVDYGSLALSLMEHLGSVSWSTGGTPSSFIRGRNLVVFYEVHRTAEDVEMPLTGFNMILVPANRFRASKTSPGFLGYGELMVREVVRSRRRVALMDPSYHMETDIFYQFLLHCLPSGEVTPREVQRQGAFPFVVLPWKSRIDAFIVVHRVKALGQGLYCLVRNHDHFDLLKRKTSPIFQWRQMEEWSEMGLPLYVLVPGNLEGKVAEIAFRQPIAGNGCFTVMLVGPCGDVMDQGLWTYSQLFWEAGVVGHLLSLDAQALGLTAIGISSFFDKRARRLLTPESGFFQTLYLYNVGKHPPEEQSEAGV